MYTVRTPSLLSAGTTCSKLRAIVLALHAKAVCWICRAQVRVICAAASDKDSVHTLRSFLTHGCFTYCDVTSAGPRVWQAAVTPGTLSKMLLTHFDNQLLKSSNESLEGGCVTAWHDCTCTLIYRVTYVFMVIYTSLNERPSSYGQPICVYQIY